MANQPLGTVTFLFTDIEGSTHLLRELGARYAKTLDEHRSLLRESFARHNGREVDAPGDGFCVVFGRARDAALAAIDGQRALASNRWDGPPVRVRMGIHTTETRRSREGYVGIGVHRGARICAAAHGGQILLSSTTRDLIAEEGLDDVTWRDLGEHRLRDLGRPDHLFQLVTPGLEVAFPPLRALDDRRTNLPVQTTVLVGRQRELAEIHALLDVETARLVTLTGPGGTGKTRLALQAAAELIDAFADGVFFVPLASLTDADLVIPALERTLGVNEAASQTLSRFLAGKSVLLVLDNLEQLPEVGPRVAQLLSEAPRLRILATSREPLHISWERIYPVPPLALPDAQRPASVDELTRCDSVALFVERARAVDPRFDLDDTNAESIAAICARLDGLPLALELAAARIGLLAPSSLLARLDDRLGLLSAGPRDAPNRHRTLRAAIAWSYELLGPQQRRAFADLSVFAGGWNVDDATTVAGVGLDELASLMDRSLVFRDQERFYFLETIREFALERLEESPEAPDLHRRHAERFVSLAEEGYAGHLDDEATWKTRLEREHDNLRAALDHLHRHDRTAEVRLAGALGWFWYAHADLREGRLRLERALRAQSDGSAWSARAHTALGALAGRQSDLASARTHLERAVAQWRQLGDLSEEALALWSLAYAHVMVGHDARALEIGEAALALFRRTGRPILVNRGIAIVGLALVATKDVDRAETLAREALATARATRHLWTEHFAEHFLGDCALLRGRPAEAIEHYRRALETTEVGDRVQMAIELQGLAMAAAGIGDARRALRLGAAADAVHRSMGVDLSGITFWAELIDRYLGQARAALGAAADAAWQEGTNNTFEAALSEARSIASSPLPA